MVRVRSRCCNPLRRSPDGLYLMLRSFTNQLLAQPGSKNDVNFLPKQLYEEVIYGSHHPVVFLPLPVVPNHTASVPVFTRKPEDSFLAQRWLRNCYAIFFGKCASFCGCGEVSALAECVPFCATHVCFEETGHFDTELDPSSLLAPNASIAKKCCADRLAPRSREA